MTGYIAEEIEHALPIPEEYILSGMQNGRIAAMLNAISCTQGSCWRTMELRPQHLALTSASHNTTYTNIPLQEVTAPIVTAPLTCEGTTSRNCLCDKTPRKPLKIDLSSSLQRQT